MLFINDYWKRYKMSVGLFAPGWTYEVLGLGETFQSKESRFWTGVLNYGIIIIIIIFNRY